MYIAPVKLNIAKKRINIAVIPLISHFLPRPLQDEDEINIPIPEIIIQTHNIIPHIFIY